MSVGAPTWRGLKLLHHQPFARGDKGVSRCPDMEGIETCTTLVRPRAKHGVSRCPDMEGIETSTRPPSEAHEQVPVGAPTSRGLKHASPSQSKPPSFRSSRCPDIEGIETLSHNCRVQQDKMSVGVPTSRGLKLGVRLNVRHPVINVSRCPDMEGIETDRLPDHTRSVECQ